ncbi:MAG: aldehyde dehydrogenase family protein, partial [Gemmatimonadota bacterium]
SCISAKRFIVHADVYDEWLGLFKEQMGSLVVGDPMEEGTDVGPLIHEESMKKVERYVQIGQEEGAQLVAGGKRATQGALAKGTFFEPTIFTNVRAGSRLEQEEIFGPVLSVIRVDSADEAFAVNNDVKYGLSSSLYTRNVELAFRAMSELDNGITYVNAPTIGAEAHLPFGGVKQTGNGHREGGWEVYEFYSETKVCYVDYSGALQRAQIDTYGD